MTFININELTDQQLADACKAGNRQAWNEFFDRFRPLIRRSIAGLLLRRSTSNMFIADDDDIVWDIHEKVVIKLYRDGGLSGCRDTRGIRPWLRTVAENQARDWLKGLDTIERLPEMDAEHGMISLDAPVAAGNKTTNIELIDSNEVDKNDGFFEFESNCYDHESNDFFSELLQEIAMITDRRKYWILRLSVLIEDSLSQDEIEELVRFSGLSEVEARVKIQEMVDDIDLKREKRETDLGRLVLYHHQQIHLARKLALAKEDRTGKSNKLVDELNGKIAVKVRQRNNLIKELSRVPKPSNQAIAELVGIPMSKDGQVTTILTRLQEKIVNRWKDLKKMQENDEE